MWGWGKPAGSSPYGMLTVRSQRVLLRPLSLPQCWWRSQPSVDLTFLSPLRFEVTSFLSLFRSNVVSVTAGGCSPVFWQAADNRGLNVALWGFGWLFVGDSILCTGVLLIICGHSSVKWHRWAEQSNGGNSERDTNPLSEPCVRIGAINVGVVQWEWGGCRRPLQSFNHNEISVSWQH